MGATNAPFGLRPLRHGGGGTLRTKRGKIASGASAIYKNSPVKIAADGTISVASAGDAFLGSFVGCEYTASGKRFVSNYFPNGTVTSDAICYYYDDPAIIYAIQGDGVIVQADIGSQADLTAAGNGDTGTGVSTATISATAVTSGTSQLRVIGLYEVEGNAWGDAYTVVEVQITEHQLAVTGPAAF